MYKVVNLDGCEKIIDELDGVVKDKEWIITKDGRIGLFKPNSEKYKYAHICEKVAYELTKLIGMPCAEIELATKDGKVGIISYDFIPKSDRFYNGQDVTLDVMGEEKFKVNKGRFKYLGEDGYSVKLVVGLLEEKATRQAGINMIGSDSLTGHSDRHAGNWGILKNIESKETKAAPSYDNSATFRLNLSHKKIRKLLSLKQRDFEAYENKILSFGRSKIIVNKKIEKESRGVNYPEINKYMFNSYFKESSEFIKLIKEKITDEKIEEIIERVKAYLDGGYDLFLDDFIKIRRDNLILEFEKSIEDEKNNFHNTLGTEYVFQEKQSSIQKNDITEKEVREKEKEYRFYLEWTPEDYLDALIEKKDISELENYKVGKFYTKQGKYYFEYIKESLEEASKAGFELIDIGFMDVDATYESEELFYQIKRRLNPQRGDYNRRLEERGIDVYDEEQNVDMEYLASMQGRTMKDHFRTRFIEVKQFEDEIKKININEEKIF